MGKRQVVNKDRSDSRFRSEIGQVLQIIDPNANGAKPRKLNVKYNTEIDDHLKFTCNIETITRFFFLLFRVRVGNIQDYTKTKKKRILKMITIKY